MKVRPKTKPTVIQDVKRATALNTSLQQLSFDKRAKELNPGGVKLRLNIKGNQRGMHNAGDSEHMKRVRAMRRLWNAKMPVLHCSNCQLSQQCPAFKPGYECAFNRFFNAHEIETEQDLIFYAKELCRVGIKRAQKMLLFEEISGAPPSLETSEALSHAFGQLVQLHDRVANQAELELTSDDSGIIGRLFGGVDGLLQSTMEAVATPIDMPGSSAEATLLEDVGANEPPEMPGSAPRKTADAELVRSFVAGGFKPKTEEL